MSFNQEDEERLETPPCRMQQPSLGQETTESKPSPVLRCPLRRRCFAGSVKVRKQSLTKGGHRRLELRTSFWNTKFFCLLLRKAKLLQKTVTRCRTQSPRTALDPLTSLSSQVQKSGLSLLLEGTPSGLIDKDSEDDPIPPRLSWIVGYRLFL